MRTEGPYENDSKLYMALKARQTDVLKEIKTGLSIWRK
jgi:hypothetical protein